MNRRRTVKPHLGLGSVVLLIAAAVVMASAGVFHAYVKNRQINVSREIKEVEDRISQHRLDIATQEVLLGDQLNPFLLRDRLKEISSDLRQIPVSVVHEVPAVSPDRLASSVPDRPPSELAVASPAALASGGP